MPSLDAILRRFRPAAAPGAAAPAAVPVDRRAELAAELTPVLSELDDVQDCCEALLREGEETAGRLRREGEVEEARLLATAAEQTPVERNEAVAQWRSAGEGEISAMIADAREEAERVTQVVAARLPGLADMIAELVRATGAESSDRQGSGS